ncbi:InlB B-repeat-containing protein [Listeria innocua]|uniref:InlB B-repeat-containing protein n=1 Tax=Listeria innocua TaxID=1642 RepID=UPI001129C574|nr:hypothetical protein [Listeria innocua]
MILRVSHQLRLSGNSKQRKITEPPITTKEGYPFTGWYDVKTGDATSNWLVC